MPCRQAAVGGVLNRLQSHKRAFARGGAKGGGSRAPSTAFLAHLRAQSTGLPEDAPLGRPKARATDAMKRCICALFMLAAALFPDVETNPLLGTGYVQTRARKLGMSGSYLFNEALVNWRGLGGKVLALPKLSEYQVVLSGNTAVRCALRDTLMLDPISGFYDEIFAIGGAWVCALPKAPVI